MLILGLLRIPKSVNIHFYEVQDEKEIANVILNINLNAKSNNVDVVKELDKEFKEDLKAMLVKYE